MTTAPADPPDEPDRPSLEGIPVKPGGTGGNNPGGANGSSEAAHVRANRALELRMAGATYSQIATALSFADRAAAYRSVQAALVRDDDRTADIRDEYRRIQLARTERLIRGTWTNAIAGDKDALGSLRWVFERQARLLGLDAPVQVTVTDDTRARITAMLDQLEAEVVPGEVLGSSTLSDTDQAEETPDESGG